MKKPVNIFRKYGNSAENHLYSSVEDIRNNNPDCHIEAIESYEEVVKYKNKEKKLVLQYVLRCSYHCEKFFFVVRYLKYEQNDDRIVDKR